MAATTRSNVYNSGLVHCRRQSKPRPAAVDDISILHIRLFSCETVRDWRRELTCAETVDMSSRHPLFIRAAGGMRGCRGRSPQDMSPAPLPRWLIGAVGIRAGRTLADWRRLVHEGVPQGQRNSTIASLTGHLLWHGVDPTVTLELLLAWNRMRCRPPLDDAEVAQVVENIIRVHDDEKASPMNARSEPGIKGAVAGNRS